MRGFWGILAGVCLFSGAANAADEPAPPPPPTTIEQLDARLAQMFKDGGVPGASVAIVENGQVVLSKGYGVADIAAKTPVTADTVFRAGSISKSITSIAVMQLVEQGKLALDAKLADLAPEVKFDNPYEPTDPVRLVHLLEHTTGWPDISLRILQLDGKGWTTLQGVQNASSEFTSRWKPGTYSVYNNAGPAVAGVIIEKTSGLTFSAYVRDRVMRPMGMATADFDLPPALAVRLAKSYAHNGGETPYQYISLPPAGSLATSAKELAQLVRFFLGRGTVDGQAILKPASVDRIERAESTLGAKYGFTNGYGLGNAPFPDKGITFRGHNGGIDSFTSVYGYSVRCNCGYVLMANGGAGVDFATPMAQMVQQYLTRSLRMEPPVVYKIADAELENYAGVYRVITPANNLTRPFQEILSLSQVGAHDGKLVVGGRDWLPTGPHTFRSADREAPGLAFFEDGGTVYKFSPFYAAEKEPWWRVITIGLIAITLALGLVVSVLMLPFWIVGWFRGRLAARGGILVRITPLLSILAMMAMFGLVIGVIASQNTSAFPLLGTVGAYSLAITLCSVLFPILALTGLVLAVGKRDANGFIRGFAGAVSIALLLCAVYTASIGWLPVMTWTM